MTRVAIVLDAVPRLVSHRTRRRRKNVPAATRYQYVTGVDLPANTFHAVMRAFAAMPYRTSGYAFVYITALAGKDVEVIRGQP
jgi:hypothetical protein